MPASPAFRAARWERESAVAVSQSPFTYAQQAQVWDGQRWLATVSLPVMQLAAASEWEAFFGKLNARQGTFLMGHPLRAAPRGVGTGTPLVNGASQTGRSLVTDGWTAGQTGILKAGDMIQLGSASTARLYQILADANSDGSGNATFDVWPEIATAWDDNAAITVTAPKGVFRLTAPVTGFDADVARFQTFSFAAASIV